MQKYRRTTGIGAVLGALFAAALASPALAQGAAGAGVPPDGEGCAPMMARWQSAEAEYSALKPADLDRYNVVQNQIDHAAHRCEAGQGAEAAAIMAASRRPPPDLADFTAKASP